MKKILYIIFAIIIGINCQNAFADTNQPTNKEMAGITQQPATKNSEQKMPEIKEQTIKNNTQESDVIKVTEPQKFDYTTTKEEKESAIKSVLKNIGFYKTQDSTDEQKIKKLISSLTKNYNKKNIEQIKLSFSENYISTDGFDKETFFKLVDEGWNVYTNLKYTTTINKIVINGNYAKVYVSETADGETIKGTDNVEGKGLLKTTSESVYHLQKYGKEWKIDSDYVISESTSIKYGESKSVPMSINAPYQTNSNQLYTATLKIDKPQNTILLASISNEPYVYPQVEPAEVFRAVEKTGCLERIVTANNKNKNEYIVASIGFTRPVLKEDKTYDIKVTGVAFLMQRVNVSGKSIQVNK